MTFDDAFESRTRIAAAALDEQEYLWRRARAFGRTCARTGLDITAAEPVVMLLGIRNRLAPASMEQSKAYTGYIEMTCAHCLRKLYMPPAAVDGRRRRTFCCEVHRREFYNEGARQARREKRETAVARCITCESEFQPSRSDARFCSSACRQKTYRRKRA